jgi:hypothetical protein
MAHVLRCWIHNRDGVPQVPGLGPGIRLRSGCHSYFSRLKRLHRRTHRGQARAPESNLQRELPAAARVHRGLCLDRPAPLPSARLLHRSRPCKSSGPRVILAVVLMESRVQILPPFGAPGNHPPARTSPFARITSPNFDPIPLASDQRSLVCHSSSLPVHATLVFLLSPLHRSSFCFHTFSGWSEYRAAVDDRLQSSFIS